MGRPLKLTHQLSVLVSEETYTRIEREADEREKSKGEVARSYLTAGIEARDARGPRS